ncbi:SprT family zinc-dependent metalloprotease [Roseateles sp. SL47]|jgi:predicted metal-dependent hydrolase|uniref:M48 family metallopeptidase n=1 Tax=Roseateles sp. SL47 TaxID=2995138 RepID=UPI00226FB68C|nr:SprT family zinc-dependent metalloprotease [Roseateles sp. SL47]WAC74659.1 SprT family zinc-dependent metalloprotease [Roseateles sp. SL47]
MPPSKLRGLAELLKFTQLSLFDSAPPPASETSPAPVASPESRVSPRGLMPPAPPPMPAPDPGLAPSPRVRADGAATRQVLLHGQPIPYELKRARRRSIGFTVSEDGLRVSAPKWVALGDIDKALQQKAEWILRKLVEQRERARRTQAARVNWGDGCSLPFLGEPLIVVLNPSQTGARLDEGRTDAQGTLSTVPRRMLYLGLPQHATPDQIRDTVQAWLQRQAKAWFEPRCRHFAAQLGVTMTGLRLSSAQTRWGSANADGVIRLNWRLIHFSPALIDYVVAHELSHLLEMNHSPRFWAVVRSVMPDYELARDRLKQAVLPLMDP